MPDRILIVDDERLTRETLVERLRDDGFQAESCASAYEALERMESQEAQVVVTDLRMPSMDGIELHRRLTERWPDTAVIFMTAFGTVASAVEAMRMGAEDYLTKPVDTEELVLRLQRTLQRQRDRQEIRRLRAETAARHRFGNLVYRAPAMSEVVRRALAVADTDINVLVQGATGTGKEVLCRAIHGHSPRSGGPFVAVNCAGLNPNLVESELFGHEAGAFTGATRLRRGRLEVASGGTLLVDEVDDLSLEIQVRLLRFLQDHTYERVGSSRTLESDVRVLCATKKDLSELVAQGRFREDLYYRINTVLIELPPLVHRKEDIVPLAEHVLREKCGNDGSDVAASRFTEAAMAALLSYRWPGNVRELRHAVEHALAFAGCGSIDLRHLPTRLQGAKAASPLALHLGEEGAICLPDLLHDCEQQAVDWALARAGGNQVRAAELLGVPRTTLRSRLAALSRDAADLPSD